MKKIVTNKRLLPVLILGATVTIVMLLFATKPKPKAQPIQETAWPVAVQQIAFQTLSPQLILYGKMISPQKSTLTAAVTAYVAAKHVNEGASVKAGQLLVSLDERDTQLIYNQRLAEVEEIKAEILAENNRYETDQAGLAHEQTLIELKKRALKRQEKLNQRNLTSKADLDQAKEALTQQQLSYGAKKLAVKDHQSRLEKLNARLLRANTQLEQAKLDLDRTKIVAPFNGKVVDVPVATGERVQLGNPIVELYKTDDVEVSAQIPSNYIKVLQAAFGDQTSNITAKAFVGIKSFDVLFDRLAGEIEQGSGGIDAFFRPIDGIDVAVGSSIKLVLALPAQSNVVALPTEALYGTNRVYTLDQENRMQSITIEIVGERFNDDGSDEIIIRSDTLREGDKIIITQLPNAITGLLVDVVE